MSSARPLSQPASTYLLGMVLELIYMVPKGPNLQHVWDPLLTWARQRKADRVRLQLEKDKELQRRVVLGADALVECGYARILPRRSDRNRDPGVAVRGCPARTPLFYCPYSLPPLTNLAPRPSPLLSNLPPH